MGIMSFWILSSAHAALTWPTDLVLDSSVPVNGILAEISINTVEAVNFGSVSSQGLLSLRIHNSLGVVNANTGLYKVTADIETDDIKTADIGIAFIGTMTLGEDSQSKLTLETVLVSAPSSVKNPVPALMRVRVGNPKGSQSLTITGKIVLIRLTDGTIPQTINYPRLSICYQANAKDTGDSQFIDIIGGNSGTVTLSRTCSIVFSGTNIDFGTISTVTQQQSDALGGGTNTNTTVSIQCAGKSSQNTLVTMSVSSASGQVTGDPSAIPMIIFGSASNDLVVKATLGKPASDCLSSTVRPAGVEENDFESNWLDVINGTNYTIKTFDKDTDYHSHNQTVNWYLCRRAGSNYLPIGQYSGSAVLSITLN